MATPKEHIEEIRRKKFSIGGEVNPLTEELHLTVKMLSAELYAKDVHFLMELIQNAEDNEYPSGVNPSLEFVITSRDITGTGAAATLLMFNNEKGFSASNINSICSVAKSTKKGNRKRGYIGEKDDLRCDFRSVKPLPPSFPMLLAQELQLPLVFASHFLCFKSYYIGYKTCFGGSD
ncbi:hypothetical protein Dsin_023845 [Dipteronia sinensis]|uniref:Uncharacterized protein n=1 Tax=Dipteronia sinensis TaxID=43782 RepID=A0AAE0A443_9ROSI|nr:hypothetical protein Dsin_023845 [Dipteronia sinensis]